MRDADRLPTDMGLELELAMRGIRRCRIEGCRGLCWDGDTCERCRNEIRALARWYDTHPARRGKHLVNLSCSVVALAVLWYLVWCFGDFIIDCWDLWFGGGQ